ncbi:MAG: hypothetical protein ACOCSN_01320 [Halanaeroarchaeum sp.]
MYCATCNTTSQGGFPTGSSGFQWDPNSNAGIRYCDNCQSVLATYDR